MEKTKLIKAAKGFARKSFEVLLVFYLLLLLINEFKPLWIASINLNYVLIAVIILGITSVLFSNPKKKQQKPTKKDYVFIIALGIVGTALIFIKTRELGWLSYIISIIAGILIILLSILVLEEDENGKED